jgi:zinc protease
MRRARAEIFAGKPFARAALGTEESVHAITLPACRRALSRTLNRQTASSPCSVRSIPPPSATKSPPPSTPSPQANRPSTLKSPNPHAPNPGAGSNPSTKEQAVLVIGFRTVDLHHPDTPALQLIDEACSDMGSRLFNRIREELGLAYYVGAQSFSVLSGGAFYFYLGTSPQQLDQAETEMFKLIQDLAEQGLTTAEIDRARITWKSSWLRSQQGNGAMADVTGWNELNGLGHDYFHRLPPIMDAITDSHLQATARRYLHPQSAFTVRITR